MCLMCRVPETNLTDKFDHKVFHHVLLCSDPLTLDTRAMQVDERVPQTKVSSDILVVST